MDSNIQSAAQTASNYISSITNNQGIKLFPSSEKNNPQNYSQIDNTGLTVYKGGNDVAKFGDTARIGQSGNSRFEINSNNLAAYSGSDSEPYFKVTANSMSYGTGDNIKTVASQQDLSQKVDSTGNHASMQWNGNVLKIESVDPDTSIPYAVDIGGDGIKFKYDNESVAMIDQDQLVIDKTVVLTEMQVNRYWTWKTHGNSNNLCLQWIGGDD